MKKKFVHMGSIGINSMGELEVAGVMFFLGGGGGWGGSGGVGNRSEYAA